MLQQIQKRKQQPKQQHDEKRQKSKSHRSQPVKHISGQTSYHAEYTIYLTNQIFQVLSSIIQTWQGVSSSSVCVYSTTAYHTTVRKDHTLFPEKLGRLPDPSSDRPVLTSHHHAIMPPHAYCRRTETQQRSKCSSARHFPYSIITVLLSSTSTRGRIPGIKCHVVL